MSGEIPEKDTQEQVQEEQHENERKDNGKKEKKKGNKKQVLSHLWKWVVAAVVLAVLLLNIFTHIFQIVNYNGTGMEPELQGGQTLVIRKTQKVEEGDVIAFYYNNQILVRRVICEGGKEIEISEQGQVSIGGKPLSEPYVKKFTRGQCDISFPYHVKNGTVFVMGDNRLEAMDSRLSDIGTIPVERIIGKVIFTF